MAAFDFKQLQACFFLIVCLVIALLSLHFFNKRNVKYPPLIKGWVPWLGCAIEFGKAPVNFIKASWQKHGAVFTFYAAGQRMTFLTDAKDFPLFFNSPQADFKHAVEHVVKNTAGISQSIFFANQRKIHDLFKGKLSASNLQKLVPRVGRQLEEYINNVKTPFAEVDLMDVVRDVLFSAVIPTLFGDDVLPQTQKEIKHFQTQFVQFDGGFEHGAKLPEFLLKEWAKSKHFLLNWFCDVLQKKSGTGVKEDILLQSVAELTGDSAPNYAVLLLWASLANSVPITFWTLAFVLSDQAIKKNVQKEADEVLGPYLSNGGSLADVTLNDIKKLRLVECCVLEAIRLRSVGIIARKLTEPLQVQGFTIPAGDMLMVSPYWAHRNETSFPDADSFIPNRWNKTAGSDKPAAPDKFIAFGGGRLQCPGRWFALMKMQMFVSVILCVFDMELENMEVPLPSSKHAVGVPHPCSPCYVKMRKRIKAKS